MVCVCLFLICVLCFGFGCRWIGCIVIDFVVYVAFVFDVVVVICRFRCCVLLGVAVIGWFRLVVDCCGRLWVYTGLMWLCWVWSLRFVLAYT